MFGIALFGVAFDHFDIVVDNYDIIAGCHK